MAGLSQTLLDERQLAQTCQELAGRNKQGALRRAAEVEWIERLTEQRRNKAIAPYGSEWTTARSKPIMSFGATGRAP
jgi:hypothetical protein